MIYTCKLYSGFVNSPKKVGDNLEAGIYAKNDDGSVVTSPVYLKGYNPQTSTWHTFDQTTPDPSSGWAGMHVRPLTSDEVGSWTAHFEATDKNGNSCGIGPYDLIITAEAVPITLNANKLSITRGDTVEFYGAYRPNAPVHIFTGPFGSRIELASTTCDGNGNYMVSATINLHGNSPTSAIIYQILACETSSVPGVECAISGNYSNTINLYVYEPAENATLTITRTQGSGSVTVIRNGAAYGIMSSSEISKIFNFSIGDTFVLGAIPDTGYDFRQWCDPTQGMTGVCWANPTNMGTITVAQTFRQVYFLAKGDKYRCDPVQGCVIDNVNGTLSKSDCEHVCKVPPPSVSFTLAVDKTTVVSGDTVAFTGKYKPNVTIGIYDTSISGKFVWVAKGIADSNGNFKISVELKSESEIDVTYQACEPSSVDPLSCSLIFDTDKSNTVTIHISIPKFVLAADKTFVPKKGTITFSGNFEPNIDINIWTYGTAGIKTHIADVKTDAQGTYTVNAVIDLPSGVHKIQACNASAVPGVECAITGTHFSNIVPITVCPPDPIGAIACNIFKQPPPDWWPF